MGSVRALQAADLFDTGTTSTPSGNYILASPFSRWVWTTDATELWLKTFNNTYSLYPQWSQIEIRINGANYQTLTAAAASTQIFQISLAAGVKTLEIVSGLQANPSGTVLGTFPVCCYLFGGTQLGTTMQTPSATNRLLIYGDSIAVGANATTPTREGWTMLMRAYRGNVALEAWGSRALYDDANTSGLRAAFVAKVAAAGPTAIWLAIGTNDYGLNKWSAASFGTAYAALLDDLHTALPNAVIYCQTPIARTSPASESANGSGSTLGNYRTQIATAQSTRTAYATLVDGTAISPALDTDGIHPTTAGHATLYTAFKAVLGI